MPQQTTAKQLLDANSWSCFHVVYFIFLPMARSQVVLLTRVIGNKQLQKMHWSMTVATMPCLRVTSPVTPLTCDGGVDITLLDQQVSGTLWEPRQQQQLYECWYHHHRQEEGPVLLL